MKRSGTPLTFNNVATTTTHTVKWGFETMEHVCNIEK
jgi:hypothetical protein